jgi:superfamily II DNA/RNA helicase
MRIQCFILSQALKVHEISFLQISGSMTNSERDSGLEKFRQGLVQVLIASKVLLAGVSLATANILIIMVSFCRTLNPTLNSIGMSVGRLLSFLMPR